MSSSTCPVNSTRIGPDKLGLVFGDFHDSYVVGASCAPPSYIRPDAAGSILPWPYTIAWFLIHFPVTLIRVHRWERVQALSIILAITTIGFHLQAYASKVKPESVLVWMPIFVVLDIGAMMQLAFLIIEESGFRPLVRELPRTFRRKGRGVDEVSAVSDTGESKTGVTEDENGPSATSGTDRARSGLLGRAWLTLSAFTLGAMLLVIQLYGLVATVRGYRVPNVTAVWCSTLFASGIAVQSGCSLYDIEPSFSQGIGCIRLRGYEQYSWLKSATIIISISLIFEVFDFVILTLVGGTTRWRGAKMKRPWFTMFTGNVVLVVLIVIGVFQSQRLPRDINQSVNIYKFEPSLGLATTCIGELTPYGVRGAVIGWTDGFLSSWGSTYSPTGN